MTQIQQQAAIPDPARRRGHSTEQIHQLYEIARVADRRFQAEVERQFGKGHAGAWRYVSSKHNEATRAAADAFHITLDAYLESCRAQRAPLSWTEVSTAAECPSCEGCGFKSYQGTDGYEERVICKKCAGSGEVVSA